MFARFGENPAMTLQDIKGTKRYGRTHTRTDGRRENSIPTTNKVCRGYNKVDISPELSASRQSDTWSLIFSEYQGRFFKKKLSSASVLINTLQISF